jgi:tRNA(Ser,Leu) C12 N-acetylase TAN1
MNLEKMNCQTISKIQKYQKNRADVLSQLQKGITEKSEQINLLHIQLEDLEQDYLVDFDSSIRTQMNEIKKQIATLQEEIEEDTRFKNKAMKRNIVLTQEDYEDLKKTFDQTKKDHDKAYQVLEKKKKDLVEAFLEYDALFAELDDLMYEMQLLVFNTFGDMEWHKIKNMLDFKDVQSLKSESIDLAELYQSAPIKHKKGSTLVQAKTNFTTQGFGMRPGQYKSISDAKMCDDLIKSGLVTKVI